jgi:enterochelin esterase-like enzyme
MPRVTTRTLVMLVLALLAPMASAAAGPPASPLPPGFVEIESGPLGGSVWQGRVPDTSLPGVRRPTVVYLPPQFSPRTRYPVVYLLQGVPGSPYQYVFGLDLAGRADQLIGGDHLPPFIAVIPPAGLTPRFTGEWTGIWEDYLVRDAVPWADRHLPTIARAGGRTIAGLSAGGYGAVDIGLRPPRLFGTLESWSGVFTAPHDGSLAHADARQLAAHDPSELALREAPLLRQLRTRVFLSSGTGDLRSARAARAFAGELSRLGIAHRLWLGAGGHDGRLWRAQLPAALGYALSAPVTGYASGSGQ